MQLTKSFPPFDDFFSYIREVDYHKLYNQFMDFVVVVCAVVAAVATVIRDKWVQYDCTERLQLFVLRCIELVKSFYAWLMNVFVPECKSLYQDVLKVYNQLRTV